MYIMYIYIYVYDKSSGFPDAPISNPKDVCLCMYQRYSLYSHVATGYNML